MAAAKRGKKGRRALPWPAVPMHQTLGELVGREVLAATHRPTHPEQVLAVRVTGRDDGRVSVYQAVIGQKASGVTDTAPADMTLADFLRKESDLAYVHALEPSKIVWPSQHRVRVPVGPGVLVSFVVAMMAAAAALSGRWWELLGLVLAAVVIFLIIWRSGWTAARVGSGNPEHREAATLRQFQRLPRPQPTPEILPDAPRAAQRAEEVKAAYGELMSDVVYRIENSALFDPAVPRSREFQLLLMRWDDESHHTSGDELDTLARELELSFDAARKNAERLGMDHLPETARPDAARAIGSIRLAESAATDGERKAALEAASRLLASLALYYLPSPDDTPALPPPPED